MPTVKQKSPRKEVHWYWTTENEYKGKELLGFSAHLSLALYSKAGIVCHSTLGHIGKPCVFCGFKGK